MTPKEQGYRMPAEWEQHECCWMQWPHDNPDFSGYNNVPTWSHFDIEKGRIAWAIVANTISKLISVLSQNVNRIKINQVISDKKKVLISFDSDSLILTKKN